MRFVTSSRGLRCALPVALALAACSDPSAPRTPAEMAVVSGATQSGVVAAALPQPIVVEVKDAKGKAIGGATVSWSVIGGGGSVNAATTTTNGSGRAQVQWTLGIAAGQNRLTATVGTVAPVTILATGAAGPAASLTVVSGSDQTGLAGQVLGVPLAVRVVDAYGNGVQGSTVSFAASAGAVSPSSATSGTTGNAQTVWTLGAVAGTQTVDATAAGVTMRFTATAVELASVPELQNDVPVPGIAATQGSSRFYRITLPANVTRLEVTTTGGTGDVDLFLQRGALPRASASGSVCQSTSPVSTESCVLVNPAGGDWYILLDAWSSYSGVELRARYTVGGSMAIAVGGLPQGANAAITITGPGAYRQTVNATTTLAGLAPGSYTVAAAFVQHSSDVYSGAPQTQNVTVVDGGMTNVTVTYTQTSGGLDLDITGAYVTQAVQRMDGSVPLVEGRPGLLRVFARGNAVNTETPTVRARFYNNGVLVATHMIAASGSSVPIAPDEAVLTSTWNAQLPGALLLPGTSMLIDIDPGNGIAEPDETNNTFPASGSPLPLDVRTVAPLQARLVPVVQSTNGLQGDVTAANTETYINTARALYPFGTIDVDVRAPYTFTGALPSQYDTAWSRLLLELNALRVAEAPTRYYYGVIKPAYTNGGTGLGYIGQRTAVGVDWTSATGLSWRAEAVAHEWGHNFGRYHVDCGGPAGPDPNYPYAGGKLGHHGWDMRTNTLRLRDSHQDLMSYCQPTWSSDYTYEAVLAFRNAQPGASGAAEPSLIVWGRVIADGVQLEPSFETVTRPSLPVKAGRYRMKAHDDAGVKVLDMAFDGYELDHMPGVRLFAYAIPLRTLGGRGLSEIRVEGAGRQAVRRRDAVGPAAEAVRLERPVAGRVRVHWDAATSPLAVVRDGRTGEILSFARGGAVDVMTSAAEVEVTVSDGVKSVKRRIAVPR